MVGSLKIITVLILFCTVAYGTSPGCSPQVFNCTSFTPDIMVLTATDTFYGVFVPSISGEISSMQLFLFYTVPECDKKRTCKRAAYSLEVQIQKDTDSSVVGNSNTYEISNGDNYKGMVTFTFTTAVSVSSGVAYRIKLIDPSPGFVTWGWLDSDLCDGIGKNKVLPGVHGDLIYAFTISCTSTSGGDPHFFGFGGQKYDVMGQSYEIYNIITAPMLQINSRFIPYYKSAGQVVPTGTMMGELGIKLAENRFYINSNSSIGILNNQEVSLLSPFEIQFNHGLLLKNKAKGRMYQITVESPEFDITFIRKVYTVAGVDDQFHFDYKSHMKSTNPTQMHGLLGQTWENKEFANKAGAFKYLDGQEDDYRIESNNIFGDEFTFNKFQI